MKNELKGFTNEDFGTIRTIMIDDIPYFVGKDVTDVLGYSNSNEAIQEHIDDEDKLNSKMLLSLEIELGQRGGWLINESGLYSLILSSKLPKAKKFKRWITSEVLPSIRQTGTYTYPEESISEFHNITYEKMQNWKYKIAYPLMNKIGIILHKDARTTLDIIYSTMEGIGNGSFYKSSALTDFVEIDGIPCNIINAIAQNDCYKNLYLLAIKSIADDNAARAVHCASTVTKVINTAMLDCEV